MVPPVAASYVNVVSTVPSVLNRLSLPVKDPPTTNFPSLCSTAVFAPEPKAAAAVFVLNVVSAAPVDENFLTFPVNGPTTKTLPNASTVTASGVLLRPLVIAVLKVLSAAEKVPLGDKRFT